MTHLCSTKGCVRELHRAGKCSECRRKRYQQDNLMRGSARHRGYTSEHDNQRKRMITPGSSCVNCGSTRALQLDHIVPLAAGGSNNIANKQVLCAECNRD